ncbi:uncharacterized protein LOC122652121 [Telopea speciosissima]|uniref:uncharacterized protein LOC122652121 n=1 Tax=Telopea speciosissima TaxID=54955 RepID=UPI001CC73870|nr:uncharacterized protein LOC122652121 [Telopea speciosissima]
MKRTGPRLVSQAHGDRGGVVDAEAKEEEEEEEIKGNDDYDVAENFKCISLHRQDFSKREEKRSIEKYGLWRQEQRIRTARMEKQLKATLVLQDLIEEQVRRFSTPSNRPRVPSKLEEVAELLMPKWMPPIEMASLVWLGDWRPSAILQLLGSLVRSSSASWLFDPKSNERLLSELIHETRIDEAVLDEEMAEIQINCILHLPFFDPAAKNRSAALAAVQSEFKKIDRVISKAQQLRYKTLDVVVTKLLSQTDAAQFLMALAGIQDTVHQFAAHQRLQKGAVSMIIKASGK